MMKNLRSVLATRTRKMIAPVVLVTAVMASTFGPGAVRAEIRPDADPCALPLSQMLAGCREPEMPVLARPATAIEIEAAKTAAANAYDAYLRGRGSLRQLEDAERLLTVMTGEKIPTPVHSGVQAGSTLAKVAIEPAATTSLQKYFKPFRQQTSFWCGPATAQSILWFLGVRQSAEANPDTGDQDWLTGNMPRDQRVLANSGWLATNRYGGTNWGQQYMPETLNAWRGTEWYVQSATPNIGNGRLDKDQALRNIQYATDRGYPVAANVLYSSRTYYPAGFMPGVTYRHWDTVYGYFERDGRTWVQVGQVYAEPGLGYQPMYEVPWDTHWSSIGNWFGIVW
jgi:hypothetical protein